MSRSSLKKDEDYLEHFSPEAYLKTTSSNFKDEGALREFFFGCYNHIFSEGQVKGRRLLDVGTGPIPLSVVSATPWVNQIYLTDYTPANREYISKWLNGSSSEDFHNMFQYFVNLEDKGEQWTQRSDELKSKLVGIFPVDLKQPKILGDNLLPAFDIITSSLCLESAATSVKDWEDFTEKLAKVLKPGGHFIINGVLGCSFYNVGENQFSVSPITKSELQNSFKKAGFTIKSYNESKGPPKKDNVISDYEYGFVMHCTK